MTARRRRCATASAVMVAERPRTCDVPHAAHARHMLEYSAAYWSLSSEERATRDAAERAITESYAGVDARGGISAAEPRERPAGPWVVCGCGAEMLASQHGAHLALAANPRAWSLHRERLGARADEAAA